MHMAGDMDIQEIQERLEIARENLRQLTEQATAFSGAADEERNSDLIAEQEAEIDRLKSLLEGAGRSI
jgi:hypothetical protein